MSTLTAQQLVKYCILKTDAEWQEVDLPSDLSGGEVDLLFESHVCLVDAINQTREGCGHDTKLPCESSRHYESESVCGQAPNGQWVGWTYWYGGGKHGCPEDIEWIEDAYLLDVKETQKTITERTFSRLPAIGSE